MRIHIIACGGAVMHNLTIALHLAGNKVTGSDDEIYNPAKDKLSAHGLLPENGWYPENLDTSIELVIVGMHAKKDNPELAKAIELGLKVMSYPAYITLHAKDKKRVVVAGSHGKTTTTSMIMHVLKENKVDYDYLVGAPLEGFDLMIKLSEAPLMVIEGDEYLSAPNDPSPKIWHYQPHITVITGIAWDHINVFPTYEEYKSVFTKYINELPAKSHVFYCRLDEDLKAIAQNISRRDLKIESYEAYPHAIRNNIAFLDYQNQLFPLSVFGDHNLQNLQACVNVCKELGLKEEDILSALTSFKGAAKRLQPLYLSDDEKIYLDFAHAPSKAKASLKAVRDQFAEFRLIAILELHTFSSLNKNFLPQYAHVLDVADEAVVFYNKHTLEIKRMPDLDKNEIKSAFEKQDLLVFNENVQLEDYLSKLSRKKTVVLFMSSGTFNGVNIKSWAINNHF